MISVNSESEVVLSILANHPLVKVDQSVKPEGLLSFQTNRPRSIGRSGSGEIGGLVELMDNNPLVCADSAWVPSPAGTLALIALGPIIEAGIVVEDPAIILSFPEEDEETILNDLRTVGWEGGITLQAENHDMGSVRGAYVLAKIKNPDDFDEIDEIYNERYSRSFLVRREEDAEWVPSLVEGQPFACYRLELSEGSPNSILAIHVIADTNGKLGAAQVVHMMNVMCGFEESLGIL